MYKFILSVLLTFSLVGLALAGGVTRGQDQTAKQGYRPGVLIVKFKADSYSNKSFKISRNQRGIASTGIRSIDVLNNEAGVTSVSKDDIYQPMNRTLASQLGINRMYILSVAKNTDIPALAKKYSADPSVEFAEPDWQAYPENIPNDTYHANHWGHNNTAQMPSYNWSQNLHNGPAVGTVGFDANAQSAWDGAQGYGSASVAIAIIDGGVEWSHPDLRIWTNPGESGGGKETNGVDDDGNGKIDDYHGWDFGVNDNNPDDNATGAGHGTCCAGVAAAIANNALGVAGIAGGCSIMPLKAADNAGSLYFSYINNAITYAADKGAKVISLSLGASAQDAANQTACTYAWNLGSVVLAATGNENKTAISYPAGNTNVIGVGAASNCGERKRSSSLSSELNPGVSADPNGYTCDGERWWGSNYGVTTKDGATAVDIIAPTILPTTDRQGANGYDPSNYDLYFNGTSCSTPYAAGVCALIFSANPTWTAAQVRNQLCNTAQDVVSVESVAGWDRYTGYGMVDAAAAVGIGATPTVTVTSPNGGENWTANSSRNVTWSSTGTIANVKIEYTTDGTNYSVVTASTTNNGTYAWTVPNTPSTTSKVRVSDATNSAINDVSNANFTISAPDVTPPVISNVASSGVTSNSATITWTTNEASTSVVNYGLTTGYGSSSSNASLVTSHSITLSGLSMNTLYHYSVTSVDASSNSASSGDFTFTTANTLAPIESFADGNFTASPVWGGNTTSWTVATSSDASTGATNSFTLRLNAASGSGTKYLSTQRTATWGTEQSWSFWMGRRSQAATATNASIVWLWANEANLTSSTVDGYRVLFGDNSGGDNIVLQRVTNGAATAVITSSGTVANGRTDYGFMVRVTRTSGSVWTLYTSTLPTANGAGAIATAQPTAANTAVSQGTATNSTYTTFTNGYFGFAAIHTTASSARTAAEFDQLYFDISSSSPMSKTTPIAMLPTTSNKPTEFKLEQNYPNPFNPTTTFGVQVAEFGMVSLKIYDVLGREVATLVNENMEPGSYTFQWNAGSMPSGVYYYKMTAGNFSDLKKLLLMK